MHEAVDNKKNKSFYREICESPQEFSSKRCSLNSLAFCSLATTTSHKIGVHPLHAIKHQLASV